jgi:magnesium-transporting ATPase (P-type)
VLRDGQEVTGVDGTLRELLAPVALATEARFDGEGTQRVVLADPTDGALLVGAERAGLSLEELRTRHPRRDLLPFDSEPRFMARGHDGVT